MQESNIITISTNHPSYPHSFQHVKPRLPLFYACGDISLLTSTAKLAVVGTRTPTPNGIDTTNTFVRSAVKAGVVIVSGLALGIDSVAHKSALESNGKTIAVLPSSIERVYPSRHQHLAQEIVKSGGLLISERITHENPNKYYFVQRNRLIAALADLILIPEAGKGTGSRHTLEFGYQMGKNSAFIPGSITNPMSYFPNEQIKAGGAVLTTPSDMFHLLPVNESAIGEHNNSLPKSKVPQEQLIMDALNGQNLATDSLLQATNLGVSAFNTHITMLEIKGIIEQTASGSWRLA